ncbi:MAG TPA: hypothetical protein VLA34_03075 [Candidatus Krumholzibacterium sp.]|nr:hypothetical protein [Candidatus Krumholzibacterium sp.]
MHRSILLAVVATLVLTISSPAGLSAGTRADLPNDFGIELGGKSILYTFTYQRMLNPYLGLEAGISAFGGGTGEDNTTILFFPLGGKFYFVNKDGSPFVTAGINIVSASFDSGPFDDSESATFGYLGAGFEYRAEMGLLFRGAAYGLISEGNFFIWPGLYIGYAF